MESTQQAVKKSKKDTKVLEQWADTKDPFVNQLYKKLRNSQKKINSILEVEQKLKKQEITATPDLLEKVQKKESVKAQMDEVLSYLNLYKESFPENPAFAQTGKKSKAKTEEAPAKVEAPKEPEVDVNKIVEDALSLVADAVIFATLNGDEGVELKGSNQNLNDSLAHILKSWSGLTEGVGSWSKAKGDFVDTFSRLIFKSATQVGTHTSKTFSELHNFVSTFSSTEGQTLLSQERHPSPVHHSEPAHHHEPHE